MIQRRSLMLLPLVAALAAACSKTPEPSSTSTETPKPAQPAAGAMAGAPHAAAPAAAPNAGAPSAAGEVAWDVPAGWETAPNPNAMRKATYKIKRAAGDAED